MTAAAIHCHRALLPEGWVENARLELDEDGTITDLARGAPRSGDLRLSGTVIPGMPNVHSHGFQRLMAGLSGTRAASGDSFWTWRETMYRLAGRIQPGQLADCMRAVYLEMLQQGFTSCAEFHYLHHAPGGERYENAAELGQQVMAAATDVGIGLTLLPVLYTRSGFGADGVSRRQARFANSPDGLLDILHGCRSFARDSLLLKTGVAPHSLRTVDADSLHALLAESGDGAVHMHVAEQPAEVEDCLTNLGARPLEWLLANCPVGPNWCLVHATHLLPAEIESGARSQAVAGLCPTTEADLGDGIFDAVGWQEAGGRFGIGTDSNLRISVQEELRLLEFTQRLRHGRRNVLADDELSCGRFLYQAACAGGAQALGQQVGRIEPGYRADLVELKADHPLSAGQSGDAVLDIYLFAAGPDLIQSVTVAGASRVRDGVHARREEIERGFMSAAAELRS